MPDGIDDDCAQSHGHALRLWDSLKPDGGNTDCTQSLGHEQRLWNSQKPDGVNVRGTRSDVDEWRLWNSQKPERTYQDIRDVLRVQPHLAVSLTLTRGASLEFDWVSRRRNSRTRFVPRLRRTNPQDNLRFATVHCQEVAQERFRGEYPGQTVGCRRSPDLALPEVAAHFELHPTPSSRCCHRGSRQGPYPRRVQED